MQYLLNESELKRMENGIRIAISIPFIDAIEDYILEAIWEYAKEIDGIDPFYNIRSKKLYDVVDSDKHIGWSVKSLQWGFYPGCEYELVIQRADVYKKAEALGYPGLNPSSDPQTIGAALLEHWHRKVDADAIDQQVSSKRIMILLKTEDKLNYVIVEEDIQQYNQEELIWRWTDSRHNGLQGIRKSDGFMAYRWYPSQKQFFERFKLGDTAQRITVNPCRLRKDQVVDILLPYLQGRS